MVNVVSNQRSPQWLKQHEDVKKGDVLLFTASDELNAAHISILAMQGLINQKHGHFDTSHTAICVGHDHDHQPIIAHVSGGRFRRYGKEPLSKMLARGGYTTAYQVFRANDETVAENIADIASTKELQDKRNMPKWKFTPAIKSVIAPSFFLSQQEGHHKKPIFSKASFCSRFVIECFKNATSRSSVYHPSIDSLNVPKTLEAWLYKNPKFSQHCYTGCDPYEAIKSVIENELTRLAGNKTHQGINKFNLLSARFKQVTRKLQDGAESAHDESVSMKKSLCLLEQLMPYLSINTGYNVVTPTSYNNVRKAARALGIRERDFSPVPVCAFSK